MNIATAVSRDARAAEGGAMLKEKLRTLHAARAALGAVHGEHTATAASA
ncbi:hypothetical protein ACFTZ8_32760 [Streptomyces fungicidicus]